MTEMLDNTDDLTFSEIPTTAVPLETYQGNIENHPEENSPKVSRFSIKYYKSYFDVTTEEVINRLKAAANPTNGSFLIDMNKIDLYGPIWMTATVSFISFALGTIDLWLSSKGNFYYKFTSLVWSGFLLSLFVFGCPFLIWYLEKENSPVLMKMMTLFGYSTVYLIPSGLVTIIIRIRIVRLIVIVAFGICGGFSIFNKLKQVENIRTKSCLIAAAMYLFVHVFVHVLCFGYF